jgi:4-amino-4-deoxy-L-arabinose transferase-like glycosyltransferase
MRLLKRPAQPEIALVKLEGARILQWLIALSLFVLALIPRGIALASFVTVDEAYHWFERADRFRQAIRTGSYAATNLIGHPGVTTMWLGALGIEIQRRLAGLGLIDGADGTLGRALMRLPIAVAASLCVALAYPLLIRLLGRRAALLAALLWATEPFLVAHSQLLHVDALLTSFMTLTLLAALVAFRFDAQPGEPPEPAPRWGYLALSGVYGGLALVTKSPALLLLPMVGLIALVAAWRARPTLAAVRPSQQLLRRFWAAVALPALMWGVIAAAVWVALWPAAWVDPIGAVSTVLYQVEADGGSPHGWGNYFLGRTVADPGPLFYPVAVSFRLAPWSLLGVLAAGLAFWRRDFARGRAALALLVVFALLFVAMMSIPPKKFDRYALPIFPALDILAAVGLVEIANFKLQIVERWRKQFAIYNLQSAMFWIVVILALTVNLAWFHPYEISYYNQLLGGGPVAARFIPIGWGEGYEQVGRFLNAQPDSTLKPVATWFGPVLRPFVPGPLGPLTWALTPGRVSYVVLYIDQIQRQDVPEATALYYSKVAPVYTVRIHGIDYAYVYQAPPAIARPLQADFGGDIKLIGYDLDSGPIAATNELTVTLNWQTRAAVAEEYVLFAHLLDARGQVVARADVPPGGSLGPTSDWQADRFVTGVFRMPIDAAPQPGRYWLSLGLYRPATGQRLPLRVAAQPSAPGAPDDGPDALRLPVTLPAAPAKAPTLDVPADAAPPP